MSDNVSREVAKATNGTPRDGFEEGLGQFAQRMGELRKHINKGVEAIGTVGESIIDVMQGFRRLQDVGSGDENGSAAPPRSARPPAVAATNEPPTLDASVPHNFVAVTVDQSQLYWIDLLVKAKIREDRPAAAAFLIDEGITARKQHLESAERKLSRMRREGDERA